jgi:hypothetical protein
MSQSDDLDALLASLLVAPEPDLEAKPALAPVVAQATLPLPELPAEAVAVVAAMRAWLDVAEPGEVFEPVAFAPPSPRPEQLDPETLLELAAARAWHSGDQDAFDKALARLPSDRAEHHRGMASVCERIRLKRGA